MPTEQNINNKLSTAFEPSYLEVSNESHKHGGSATDSHFKVVIAAEAFANKRPVQRHQLIYALFAEELAGAIHALALHTYTPEEWLKKGSAPASPNCMGGSKKDQG